MTDATVLARLIAVVGEKNAITDAADMTPYLREWRDKWFGTSPLVLRPASTKEVSDILAIAHETNTKIVPQSGNTGLVGGGMPDGEVLLSLDRMTRIIAVDAADYSITVEAGATLKAVQDAAAVVDRLFALSLASEGSCRIGGNLATNAGGLNVVAYGNAREQCLGLEVVLADGRIWNGLRKLRKDNTGYDLRDLFIGSEGTLGIITAAVLKLHPRPKRYDTGFIAVPTPQAGVDLFGLLKNASGNKVVAFELVPEIGLQFTETHMGTKRPLASVSPWYVLAEVADAPPDAFTTALEHAMERALVTDAVIAASDSQRQALWDIRDKMSESQKHEGGSVKHDVSVPISTLPQFIAEATEAVAQFMPGARVVCFGHMGDGNMHFNVSQPAAMDKQAYLARWTDMNAVVFAIVRKLDGSISAEHGIGRLKRDLMREIKSPVELELMQQLKQTLDPRGILNPGKVLPG